jgi:transposase
LSLANFNAYVGMDVHKDQIAIAVADSLRGSEVRYWGQISSNTVSLRRTLRKLADVHGELLVCYEAGPCGYWIYRQLIHDEIPCMIVAPSQIPKTVSEVRMKNDRRDAVMLARLLRAGELTSVWVPDETHEAMRDVVRARHACSNDRRRARQRIQSFLLKYHFSYSGKAWTVRHRVWLSDRTFAVTAQQVAFQNYLNAHEQIESRMVELEQQIRLLLPDWSLAPQVIALQALKGVALTIAVSFVCEVGDIRRFDHPRQLMAYLGLVPGEHSSGGKVRTRGITKVGNRHLRSLLFEAAWNYTRTPKVGQYMRQHRPAETPQSAIDIAWKAQVRLHRRYKALVARRKRGTVAITAVARELVGFMWAISIEAAPDPSPEAQ